MELILVRHGQPRWVVDGRNQNDPELTELGHAQAACVATRLADVEVDPADGPVDHLVVSPARRAQETCAPVASSLTLEPAVHPWLLELGMPDEWDDGPIEVVEAAFAEQRGRPRADWWAGIPGAEPLDDFHDRVADGVNALLGDLGVTPSRDRNLWEVDPEAPERIVAVAHAGTNSAVIAHLLGVEREPWEWERFAMGHASVAVLSTQPLAGAHIWSLRALGDAAHIPRPDRTA